MSDILSKSTGYFPLAIASFILATASTSIGGLEAIPLTATLTLSALTSIESAELLITSAVAEPPVLLT